MACCARCAASATRSVADSGREQPPASQSLDLIAGGAGWLIHHLPMGVLIQGADGQLLEANPAALHLLGLTTQMLAGLSSLDHRWEILNEAGEALPQEQQPAMQAITTGEVYQTVVSLRTLAGERRWMKVTAIPQFASAAAPLAPGQLSAAPVSSGQAAGMRPTLVYSVFDDVTASHTMSLDFQRSEQRYRALVLATSQYVWTNDPDGYMTSEQPDWAALTGQRFDQYRGYGWAEALHPGDRERTIERWQAAVAARGRFEDEHRVMTAAGEYRTYSVRAIPLLGTGGELLEWVGLHTDVTPLREAEAALKAVNADLSNFNALLLDSAGEGIFGLDHAGRAVFANPAAAALLGYTVEELEGQPMHALIHARHPDGSPYPEADCPISQMLNGGEYRARRVEGEVFWRKDGSAMPVEYVVTPLQPNNAAAGQDPGGQGLVLIFQDVTAAQSARAALESAIQELERSNRELEQFAYVSSHDLQEPLRTVGSYAELLGRRYRGKLDPRADQYLQFMQEAVTRMRQLINDLLSFSRIGKNEVALRPVPLDEVMRNVRDSLETVLRENGAELLWQDLPVVQGHTVQLGQLMNNLVSNSRKFRQQGVAPRIEVQGWNEGDFAHLTVSDNGIGIAPEFQERVFGLFQRLHRREEYEGTGLGLAICRKIAQTHGGEIWLESGAATGADLTTEAESRTGTTVHLRLPLAGTQAGSQPSLPPPSAPPSPELPPAEPRSSS